MLKRYTSTIAAMALLAVMLACGPAEVEPTPPPDIEATVSALIDAIPTVEPRPTATLRPPTAPTPLSSEAAPTTAPTWTPQPPATLRPVDTPTPVTSPSPPSAPAATPAPALSPAAPAPPVPPTLPFGRPVKKDHSSDVCHAADSPDYATIADHDLYRTMDECLNDGGKPYTN